MIVRNATRRLRRTLAAALLCLVTAALAACGGGAGGSASAGASARPSAAASTGPVRTPDWAGGLPVVRAAELPPQARDTLLLIDRGGPYPYRQDGTVFGNFERVLPRQKRGYYHEYTVRTPGSRDRGARRLVTGQGGELFYTGDHYKSFKAVLR
ncbi:ribonuclease domain-containing protein [Streptomyces sp. NPDC089919]|uniref:ribonuclease domain-containing protein n=1 Tax=Streptomyces sp. NPDC089919 TaxID=3155188 RepID=UPI00344ADDF0